MQGIRWHGQPVYRMWLNGKTRLRFFSREITELRDGSWKLKRYVTLHEIKIDQRHAIERIVKEKRQAELDVLRLPGVVKA